MVESSLGWSDGIAVLSLSFNPRREYNFTCVVRNYDYDYGVADSAFELLYDPSGETVFSLRYYITVFAFLHNVTSIAISISQVL